METNSNAKIENNSKHSNESSDDYLLEETFPHKLLINVVSVQAFLNEMLIVQDELIGVLNLMELDMLDIMQPIIEVNSMEKQVKALDETRKKCKEKINDCFEHDSTASINDHAIQSTE
ncbi:uncharacterized protein LOC126836985 [Adelges cooleyi]|uniref:uncharacterized protein LOC126836985 n=1 Tax=Adelges cooleyi TaxID=133065 RepID=UPI00217F7BDB|nr:uncharacterized protein LOC126836985 [Adelges cooleyi]